MQVEVDLISEVVLLINDQYEVVDVFHADGKTLHDMAFPASFYTYRGLLTEPGTCFLCGKGLEAINEPCVSSGGFHAFTGVADRTDIPDGHKAENRNVALVKLTYDEFVFYLEPDNVFPVSQIAKSMVV